MKIEGYVICQPLNEWDKGDWHPKSFSFGETPVEAWIRFTGKLYGSDEWDRTLQAWMDRGYRVKKATMEVNFDEDVG